MAASGTTVVAVVASDTIVVVTEAAFDTTVIVAEASDTTVVTVAASSTTVTTAAASCCFIVVTNQFRGMAIIKTMADLRIAKEASTDKVLASLAANISQQAATTKIKLVKWVGHSFTAVSTTVVALPSLDTLARTTPA